MMEFREISVNSIDQSDRLFFIESHSTRYDLPDSIEDYFQPLWVQIIDNDSFRIIDGFRRFETWREQRPGIAVPAVISPMNSNIISLWKQRSLMKNREEGLGAYSFLTGIANLLSYTKNENIAFHDFKAFQKLGLPQSGMSLRQIDQTLAQLYQCQDFCDLFQLSYHDIKKLNGWNKKDLSKISPLLTGLNLKGNKLISILDLIDEITKGQRRLIQSIIDEPSITACLKIQSSNQRYAKLKNELINLRYPRLQKMRQDWQSAVKRINLREGISVKTDVNFESDHLTFQIEAMSKDELLENIVKLQKTADGNVLDPLFAFI